MGKAGSKELNAKRIGTRLRIIPNKTIPNPKQIPNIFGLRIKAHKGKLKRKMRARTSNWWINEPVGIYCPKGTLDESITHPFYQQFSIWKKERQNPYAKRKKVVRWGKIIKKEEVKC
jgi:hypothetical protein